MHINRINSVYYTTISINNNLNKQTKTNQYQEKNTYNHNPIAYRDCNISFGARLFRTPENFYEQDFNQNNMPESMKKYLKEDYNDRQHIPPAQMMKIVFGDIQYADSLEEVKELSDDPLFANLHQDNKRHRDGILAEISLMREPNKSLFKNGKDDLGIYVLKKIYLEGKTLKEINSDFKKDVSVHYNGLSEITYQTLDNFGIKFPKNSFWKSFIATREDFPYVPIKRKDAEYHSNNAKRTSGNKEKSPSQKEKPKYNFKDHELKKIIKTISDSNGDENKLKKGLKKCGYKEGSDEMNFICKYMGPIMSITHERMHTSEEMSDSSGFNDYWKKHPDFKSLQSMIMSDTIQLFTLTYGANGNNEDFKELLEYANSIKTTREEKTRIHDEIQADYEEKLGIQETTQDNQSPIKESNPTNDDGLYTTSKEELKKEYNTTDYKYTTADGRTITISMNLKDALNSYAHSKCDKYFPKSFAKKYSRFLENHPMATDLYKISLILRDSEEMKPELEEILLPEKEIQEISIEINNDFAIKYPKESRAVIETYVKALTDSDSDGSLESRIYNDNLFNIVESILSFEKRYKSLGEILLKKLELTKNIDYAKYMQPLKHNEIMQITKMITKELVDCHADAMDNDGYHRSNGYREYITPLALYYNDLSDKEKRNFNTSLSNFIEDKYGPSARILLENDTLPMIKKAKMANIFVVYVLENRTALAKKNLHLI